MANYYFSIFSFAFYYWQELNICSPCWLSFGIQICYNCAANLISFMTPKKLSKYKCLNVFTNKKVLKCQDNHKWKTYGLFLDTANRPSHCLYDHFSFYTVPSPALSTWCHPWRLLPLMNRSHHEVVEVLAQMIEFGENQKDY